MNRKYDTARFAQSVDLLNQYFEHPAITTDLITGFPEETEEEFARTLDFIRRCRFAQMHIFPYSIRPGTPAAKMRQVPKAVKEERARRAAEIAAELHRTYLEECVGGGVPRPVRAAQGGQIRRPRAPTTWRCWQTAQTCTTRCGT